MATILLTSTQETLLLVGTIGMALGALAIGMIGKGLGKESHHAVASFFVCAIAACLYLLMYFGQGIAVLTHTEVVPLPQFGKAIVASSARLVFYGRYVDWIFTTPLLLIGLIGVGMKSATSFDEMRSRGALVGTALGADVLMIITGLFGAMSWDEGHKYIWFAVSCLFFLIVLAVIWGPVRAAAKAQGSARSALYMRLLGILSVLWFVYPILWLLGTEGGGSLSLNGEVLAFTVIDLLAKVGFGLVLVTGVKDLESASQIKATA